MYESTLLLTPLAQAQSAPQGGSSMMLIIMVLLFVGMMFITTSSQRKKQKEHKAMIEALQPGDEIITSGGLYAIVVKVKDEQRIEVRLSDDTRVFVNKGFVQSKVTK